MGYLESLEQQKRIEESIRNKQNIVNRDNYSYANLDDMDVRSSTSIADMMSLNPYEKSPYSYDSRKAEYVQNYSGTLGDNLKNINNKHENLLLEAAGVRNNETSIFNPIRNDGGKLYSSTTEKRKEKFYGRLGTHSQTEGFSNLVAIENQIRKQNTLKDAIRSRLGTHGETEGFSNLVAIENHIRKQNTLKDAIRNRLGIHGQTEGFSNLIMREKVIDYENIVDAGVARNNKRLQEKLMSQSEKFSFNNADFSFVDDVEGNIDRAGNVRRKKDGTLDKRYVNKAKQNIQKSFTINPQQTGLTNGHFITSGVSNSAGIPIEDAVAKENERIAKLMGSDTTATDAGRVADNAQDVKIAAQQKSEDLARKIGIAGPKPIDFDEGSTEVYNEGNAKANEVEVVKVDSTTAKIAEKGGIRAENGTFYKPTGKIKQPSVGGGKYVKAGATAIGALMATGSLVSALNSSRGQQSNAQLYGQQPLY